MAFNRTILMGNLTADPELRRTQTGTPVCSFAVAVKRKRQDVTDFHDCVAWGKTAEILCQHFYKGKEILVEGEMQKRSYTDKDGNKRWVTELNVDSFAFTGRKDDGERAAIKDAQFVQIEEDDGDELPF